MCIKLAIVGMPQTEVFRYLQVPSNLSNGEKKLLGGGIVKEAENIRLIV